MAQPDQVSMFVDDQSAREYSDLFGVSGSSFLIQASTTFSDESPLTTITPTTPAPGNDSHPEELHTPQTSSTDQSCLIDFNSRTPSPPPPPGRLQLPAMRDAMAAPQISPRGQRPMSLNLMDHSISAFDFNENSSNHTIDARSSRHLLFSPPQRRTPSPGRSNQVLSTPADLAALSLGSRQRSSRKHHTISGSSLSQAHFTELSVLPPATPSNRRDITPVQSEQPTALKATKSILKRPNSPSKGARARFFNPRIISHRSGDTADAGEASGDTSELIDENGNLKARETVHEFERDAPPNQARRSNPSKLNHLPRFHTPQASKRARTSSSGSIGSAAGRRTHLPRFTIPEPADLGIDPILPPTSTSPSPSPPPLPPARYLMNTRTSYSLPNLSQHQTGSTSMLSNSNSIQFGLNVDNVSNILDESGAEFVGGAEDSAWAKGERSTEQSIDLKHEAMLQILGNKPVLPKPGSSQRNHPRAEVRKNLINRLEVHREEEEDEEAEQVSVDVNGLIQQMERKDQAEKLLNDEPAPDEMLRQSQDTLNTIEMSRFQLPKVLISRPVNQVYSVDEEEVEELLVGVQDNKDEEIEFGLKGRNAPRRLRNEPSNCVGLEVLNMKNRRDNLIEESKVGNKRSRMAEELENIENKRYQLGDAKMAKKRDESIEEPKMEYKKDNLFEELRTASKRTRTYEEPKMEKPDDVFAELKLGNKRHRILEESKVEIKKDNLFEELMSDPPPSLRSRASRPSIGFSARKIEDEKPRSAEGIPRSRSEMLCKPSEVASKDNRDEKPRPAGGIPRRESAIGICSKKTEEEKTRSIGSILRPRSEVVSLPSKLASRKNEDEKPRLTRGIAPPRSEIEIPGGKTEERAGSVRGIPRRRSEIISIPKPTPRPSTADKPRGIPRRSDIGAGLPLSPPEVTSRANKRLSAPISSLRRPGPSRGSNEIKAKATELMTPKRNSNIGIGLPSVSSQNELKPASGIVKNSKLVSPKPMKSKSSISSVISSPKPMMNFINTSTSNGKTMTTITNTGLIGKSQLVDHQDYHKRRSKE